MAHSDERDPSSEKTAVLSAADSMLVQVAVPLGVRKTFHYQVPERFLPRLVPGVRVLVPFGRTVVTGLVVALTHAFDGEYRLRPIRDVLDVEPLISPELIQTALWISDRYLSGPGEVLFAMLPAGMHVTEAEVFRLSPKAKALLTGGLRPVNLRPYEYKILDLLLASDNLNPKQVLARAGIRDVGKKVHRLLQEGWVHRQYERSQPRVSEKKQLAIRALDSVSGQVETLSPKQKTLYEYLLSNRHWAQLQEVLRVVTVSHQTARGLEKKGLVEITLRRQPRQPRELTQPEKAVVVTLTDQQQVVFAQLSSALKDAEARRYLLHGVTGSGKTEVYLRLISEATRSGGSALFLVPEIGLTPLLSRLVVSRFPGRVAVMHSGMSDGERYDQWNRIRMGSVSVVVGTRSAVFAPLKGLRLIVLDEEQDSSYKQEEAPYYHAREVAWQRVKLADGLLVMGSATPSIETFYASRTSGDTGHVRLTERVESRPLPKVEIVDMATEFRRHGPTVLSTRLQQSLNERLGRGEQSIVLLNRRGYARAILCRSCGHVFTCGNCSIAMIYHRSRGRLLCHYCGIESPPPSRCESCDGEYVHYKGVGTEQLEEILRAAIPHARIARVDRDSTRRRGTLREILLEFSQGKLDLLVGTQMLAKGHDFPNVTLVGVLNADAGLAFPDFRSAERTFQLLAQVGGRAGRGHRPGAVVIQSFHPNHYALRFAKSEDYQGFFEHELEYRRLMQFPPFRKLVQILISDSDERRGNRIGQKIAQQMKTQRMNLEGAGELKILGPATAPLERIRGKYRFQILIKVPPRVDAAPLLHGLLDDLLQQKVPLKGVQILVDPLSLL